MNFYLAIHCNSDDSNCLVSGWIRISGRMFYLQSTLKYKTKNVAEKVSANEDGSKSSTGICHPIGKRIQISDEANINFCKTEEQNII